MTTRDRLGLIGIGILALLAVGWFLVVSPERKEASSAAAQVTAAQTALASAQGQASSAAQARVRYSAAYASVVRLGKAVPPSEEVPSLIYQLGHATNNRHVEFNSITTGSSEAGASAAAPAAATAAATTAGFTQMPFTFIFDGSFTNLYHVFNALNAATVRTTSGGLLVSGRLLTVQGVKLEPSSGEGQGSGLSNLTATVTATAYVLPAGQGVAPGASASSPASTAATTAASGSGSSPAAPVATIGPAR